MPKKKKTRKQKALADVRRQTEPKATNIAIFENTTQTKEDHAASPKSPASTPIHQAAPRSITTANYQYVAGDLRKTLLLTAAIIVIELGIKFGTGI